MSSVCVCVCVCVCPVCVCVCVYVCVCVQCVCVCVCVCVQCVCVCVTRSDKRVTNSLGRSRDNWRKHLYLFDEFIVLNLFAL